MKKKLCILFIFSLSLSLNYFPASAQNIPDFLVNEQAGIDGSEQSTPYIDGDGNGNYVITWKDNRNGTNFDIYAQIYLSDGTKLGDNFKVTDSNETDVQYFPVVAVDPNLNFVIAWLDKKNPWEWNVYAQRFSNDGTKLGSNFIVNNDTTEADQEHPSISIDSCGNFVIVWTDKRSGDWDIYAQRYLSDGSTIGDNFKINDDVGNSTQYWPTSSCNKSGNLIVSWVDKRYNDNYDIYAQRFLADGTPIGNNFKVNTDIGDSYQFRPDIAIKENGDFIITWGDERNGDWDVYAQRYLSDGSPLGDNFKISDDTTNTSQRNPSISTDLMGNFIVSWESACGDSCDIYARRFTYDAIPIGSSFRVSTETGETFQYHSEIMEDKDGNFTITWEDRRLGFNGDIFAQSYLNDGTAIEDNFKVNDDIGSENQGNPSIAKDDNDNFIIAWIDNRNGFGNSYNYGSIYAQRFSSDGTALGSNILANYDSTESLLHFTTSIAVDAEGNFVIVWDACISGDPSNIFAQRFSSDGTPLGENFLVNNNGRYLNYCPVVACKKNGDFIIVWGDSDDGSKNKYAFRDLDDENILESNSSKTKKGTEPDIFAQQYLSDGTPLAGNFKVNDDIGNTDQVYPDIAVDTNGNFIIIWQDNRNVDWDLYIQRFLSDGTPVGSNLKLIDSLACSYNAHPSISTDADGNFIIVWNDKRNGNYDIFAQRYLFDGTPIGNNFRVNDDNSNNSQSYPNISVNEFGNFIIAWNDLRNGYKDVYAQRYLSNGTALGSNYMISNTGDLVQNGPVVVLGDDRVFASWQDNRGGQTGFDIWANVYDWEIFNHEIALSEGYQFISSNIDPFEADMLIVMEELLNDNLSFVRNSAGATLQKIGPNWVNGIGDWIVSEGYLVKMFASDSFSINGFFVDPTTPIPVEQGFQFVSYFPENNMDALIAFETIMNDNLDYIRNSQGQTLRKIGPIWVNGIGDCQPSEGYLVKMFASGEIIYPASAKSSGKTIINPTYFSFDGGNAADPVYTMYVSGLEIGDEIAAFDGDKIIGVAKINSHNVFENELPVFSTLTNGKGYEAGNQISLKVWSENNIVAADFTMKAMYDSYVSEKYPNDDGKYSIVNVTKGSAIANEKLLLFPNPATEIITIVSPTEIRKLSIFNCFGQSIFERNINEVNIQINTKDFETGIYVIRIETTNCLETHKIIIK
ncbi:MAG: T9SS type A sorting domain-containing protein [Bacteroidales bacterium]|nr:T9SS type A sorting domain-containing protein [Bacteroidales bacterium]